MKIDHITPAQYGFQLYVVEAVERLGFRIEAGGDDFIAVTDKHTNLRLGEFGTLQGVLAYVNGYVKGLQRGKEMRDVK